MSLIGKVALVTGASRGIGRGIAIELAKAGATVVINYSKDDKGAEETINSIKKVGVCCDSIKGDVREYYFCEDMIKRIVNKFGKIDILVNNAGISKIGMLIDMSEEDYEDIMNVNFKSVFNTSKNALKYMLSKKSGVIINISSMWGEVGASCEVLYSASKGAINSFTKALAKEVGPSKIRVNAISPGVIDTDMNKCFSEEERQELKEEIPLMEFGNTEDIGRIVVFLCEDSSKYITAQVIRADGGMV